MITKRRVLALAAGVASVLVLGSGVEASAYGWGGRDNPDWNESSAGVDAAGRCAGITARTFSGTIKGEDGLGVNATIGFNIIDGNGRNIDLATGCVVYGYSSIVQLNHYVSFQGAAIGSRQKDARGAEKGPVTADWVLRNLPSNAKTVWIETYTRAYNGSPCGMSCAGPVNTSKYGWTNRRAIPVGANTVVNLVAPRTPAYGGKTGTIEARVVDATGTLRDPHVCSAPAVTTNCVQVHAWSMLSPEGSALEGWGAGGRFSYGQWRFPALASNQKYRIRYDFFDGAGRMVKRVEGFTFVHSNYTARLSVRV